MKTPIEELIESIEPILTNGQFDFSYKAGIASAVTKAKKLLEKEKRCIIDAYNQGGIDQCEGHQNKEQYYKETFSK